MPAGFLLLFAASASPRPNVSGILSQTQSEVCFANLLGVSQSNQVRSQDGCISFFLCNCDKMCGKKQPSMEGLFWRFAGTGSPWGRSGYERMVTWCVDRKQGHQASAPTSRSSLPPVRCHFLKAPQPFKTASLAKNQGFKRAGRQGRSKLEPQVATARVCL